MVIVLRSPILETVYGHYPEITLYKYHFVSQYAIMQRLLTIRPRRVLEVSSGSYFITPFNAGFQNTVRHVS